MSSITQYLNSRKSILITGGAGFIGGALIRKLLKDSNFKIINIDKIGYASDIYTIDKEIRKLNINKKRYELLKIDLVDFKDVINAVEYANPDLIMHLAAESHVDRSIRDSRVFIESNIIGTYNLLESTRTFYNKLKGQKKNNFKFHHISSDEVYGSLGGNGSFNEKTAYDPRSPYSASKASSDHLVNAWWHTYNIPIILTNSSNNYGPYQYPEKLIPKTIINAIKSKDIELYGDGRNIRDWLYIDDHIDALLLALSRGCPGERYCIGGNEEMTNKDLVMHICKILNNIVPRRESYESLIKYIDDRPGHDFRYSINSKKIQNELGWSKKVCIKEGLNKTINWYIKNKYWSDNIILE